MESQQQDEELVTIKISKSTVLVLDNILAKWDISADDYTIKLEDKAEWQALANLLGVLEKELAEPFVADYTERLEAAKRSLTPDYSDT